MGLFSKAKDRVVEQVAIAYLNTKLLAPYGRATRLSIDSTGKAVHIELELNGENRPVQVDVTDYELKREGNRYSAVLREVRTSREWLTALAENYVCRKRFDLPARVGRVLIGAL